MDLEDEAGPPGATLRHLLTHSSGCFYDSERTLQAPGLRRHYSNYGIDEAARHIERAIGRDYGDWIQERIAGPLGMDSLQWSGSASVGAHGPLTDLALFAAELLQPTLLEPRWHTELTRAQFPELVGIMPGFGKQDPNPFGLGIEVRGTKSPHWTGARNSEGTVGHFGMRGTAFWVDPAAGLRAGGRHLPRLLRCAPRGHAAPRRCRARGARGLKGWRCPVPLRSAARPPAPLAPIGRSPRRPPRTPPPAAPHRPRLRKVP